MLRRLFAIVVLLGIVGAGLYLWTLRYSGGSSLGVSAHEFALSLNRELKGSDIDVGVDRREVTLSGEVATRAQVEVRFGTQ